MAGAPLGLPKPEETSPNSLPEHDAVRLFVDRATAVKSTFVLDADAASAVHHICHRLDDMLLALELAAARVRVLPPGDRRPSRRSPQPARLRHPKGDATPPDAAGGHRLEL